YRYGERFLLIKPVAKCLTLHDGHDEEEETVGFAGVIQGEDVWVGQASSEFDLSEKALAAKGFGKVGIQDFEGNVAIVSQVVREIDASHAARAEFPINLVSIGEGGAEAGVDDRQRALSFQENRGDMEGGNCDCRRRVARSYRNARPLFARVDLTRQDDQRQ